MEVGGEAAQDVAVVGVQTGIALGVGKVRLGYHDGELGDDYAHDEERDAREQAARAVVAGGEDGEHGRDDDSDFMEQRHEAVEIHGARQERDVVLPDQDAEEDEDAEHQHAEHGKYRTGVAARGNRCDKKVLETRIAPASHAVKHRRHIAEEKRVRHQEEVEAVVGTAGAQRRREARAERHRQPDRPAAANAAEVESPGDIT